MQTDLALDNNRQVMLDDHALESCETVAELGAIYHSFNGGAIY